MAHAPHMDRALTILIASASISQHATGQRTGREILMRNDFKLIVLGVAVGAILGGAEARASGATAVLQARIPGQTADAYFGYSVAVDGNTAVIGSITDNSNKGAAYVFSRGGSGWTLTQELTPSDGGADGALFGYAVAVSGNTVMVGAPGVTTPSAANGSVYVYSNSGTGFSAVGPILTGGSNAQPNDCFGCAIALRSNLALIGAPGSFGNMGQASVFSNGGSGWTLQQSFLGSAAAGYFGFSVALSSDASTALIGAFAVDNSTNTGRAYAYVAAGGSWTEQGILSASDGQPGDNFGYALAVDGNTAIVGAYGRANRTGAAYIFERSGGVWASQGPLVAADAAQGDYFGWSVAISGTTAVIGASEKTGSTGPGAAYVFAANGAVWSQQQELFAQNSGEYFGYAVAQGGATSVIGAFGAGSTPDTGAAYVFAPVATAAPAAGSPLVLVGLALMLIGAGLVSVRIRFGENAS